MTADDHFAHPGLASLWSSRWESGSEQVLLSDAATSEHWTGADLLRDSEAFARHLRDAGVSAGDAVILSGMPSATTALAFIALLRMGCVAVPANTAATPRELAHYATVSGARVALADDPGRFSGVTESAVALASLRGAAAAGGPTPALDQADAGDRALICFTSGTTGSPKGAPLTHGNLLAGTSALVECWAWSEDDILVSALPMFHVHGLLVALAGTLTAGGRIVVHPRFDADAIIDSARDASATLLFGVPTMWSRFVESGRLGELDLRLAVSGSAPLAPPLFDAIEAAIGQQPVERYGMTETMILTSTPIGDQRFAGTVGRPLPGIEVRLSDDGGVEVRGGSVFDGYIIDSPDQPLNRASFTEDGWFRTGDIGEWVGPDLRLVGRSSELIISGGYNVYPREVEDVLRTDAAISDVAVIGLLDDTWGERVVAAVVLADEDGTDEDRRARWEELCDLNLAPYKKPRAWFAVDELPRNAMGKVQRDVLRTRLS